MTTTSRPALRRTLAAAVLLLAPVAVLLCWLLARDDLPSPIATHFRLDGTPDGFSSPGGFVLGVGVAVAVLAGLGLAGLVRARSLVVVRVAVALAGWMAWLLALVVVCILWPQRGHAVAVDGAVRLHWYVMFVPLLLAGALGLLLHRLVPPGQGPDPVPPAPAPYTLAQGERATWVGRARSRTMLVLGVLLALGGALGAVWLGGFALVVAGVGLLLGWVSEIFVRVDGRGVSAHFGPVGWPRIHVPLERITAARAETVEPLRWGGWGYRIGPRGTALVVRRGPGLVLARREATDLAITVDDPGGAADLVNALLARESVGRG